jgi:DNA invertase Pin-like site-specific DNA recombinase/peptidoglycan hydrolase-like protein with peptidoglycan-binding domain
MLVLLAVPGTAMGQRDPGATFRTESSLLARGAGYADPAAARDVEALQRALRTLGWRPGPVDGLFGPRTAGAVAAFQRDAGLVPDEIVGRRTAGALQTALDRPLRRGAGYAQPDGSPRVRRLQRRLSRMGLEPGPVDGLFGPRTQAAVVRLQRAGGVAADGIVGTPTQRLLDGGPSAPDSAPTERSSAPAETPDRPAGGSGTSRTRPESGDELRIRNTEDSEGLPILAVAALAAALAGLAGMLLGRLRPATGDPAVAPEAGLAAEGWSHDRSIGGFQGPVHAIVVGRRGLRRRQETRYLVSDPNHPHPFWVRDEEVTKLVSALPTRWDPPPRQATPAPTQPAPTQPAPAPEQDRSAAVRALGYVSVPETETGNGGQPREQIDAIDSLCEQRGWELLQVVRDREESRGTALDRPGLGYALERLGDGEASCLVVPELRHLGRSAADLGRVLEAIEQTGVRLVALDDGIDTSSPEGRTATAALVAVGGWERERLAERTRRGLEVARAKRGRGVRPSVDDVPALKQRIVELRDSGLTLQAIADRLNAEGVPTLRGGAMWRPSSVQAAVGYRRPGRQSGALVRGGNENGGRDE